MMHKGRVAVDFSSIDYFPLPGPRFESNEYDTREFFLYAVSSFANFDP